jgi:hypothetical protein
MVLARLARPQSTLQVDFLDAFNTPGGLKFTGKAIEGCCDFKVESGYLAVNDRGVQTRVAAYDEAGTYSCAGTYDRVWFGGESCVAGPECGKFFGKLNASFLLRWDKVETVSPDCTRGVNTFGIYKCTAPPSPPSPPPSPPSPPSPPREKIDCGGCASKGLVAGQQVLSMGSDARLTVGQAVGSKASADLPLLVNWFNDLRASGSSDIECGSLDRTELSHRYWVDCDTVTASPYCLEPNELGKNPCAADSTDYCCDTACSYCGPKDFCDRFGPFKGDAGICDPDFPPPAGEDLCPMYFAEC